ncbi:glycosyltransferase family 2 protein [Demequina maris]|uniref:glycosyltransferase family 2 protein n=1 Tax=Demequina maris TaxID=1638982 RepID=UPI00155AF74B|nr:glycosyltransferase [Demequina maris]
MTVTHNSSGIMRDFLEALLEDSAPGVEVVVVDSGSADVAQLREETAWAKVPLVVTGQNIGYGNGSNLGARSIDADWIAFVNPDVKVAATDLLALARIASETGVGCIGPLILGPDGRPRPVASNGIAPPWRRRRTLPDSPDALQFVRSLSGSCMVISREAFEEVGGFDPAYFMFCEEIDLQERLWERGHAVAVTGEVSAFTEGGASSSTASRRWAVTERDVAHVQYVRKHYSTFEAVLDALAKCARLLVSHEYRPRSDSLRQYVQGISRVMRIGRGQ